MNKLEKLQSMMGKTFIYEENEITLLTYKQTKEKIELVTNGDWITTTIFDLEVIFSKMKEVVLPQVTMEEAFDENPKFVAIKNDSIGKVQDSLLEMIDKIKESKDNIPQAEAIVSISNSIVQTEKLKLEQISLLNKIQQL